MTQIVSLAAIFYASMAGVALLWNWIAQRPATALVWWVDPGRAPIEVGAISLLLGLLFGILIVAWSTIAMHRFRWAQQLRGWFADVLGPLRHRDVLALALLSSVSEELLFRGAMQASLGLIPTAAIFGLLHLPNRAAMWPWTLSALLIGLALGSFALWAENLVGPICAHFVINWLNLRQITGQTRSGHTPPEAS